MGKIALELDREEAAAVAERLAGSPETDKISLIIRNALGEPEIHAFHWEDDNENNWRIFHKDGGSIRFDQLGDDGWECILDLSSDVDVARAYKNGFLANMLEELAIIVLAADEEE